MTTTKQLKKIEKKEQEGNHNTRGKKTVNHTQKKAVMEALKKKSYKKCKRQSKITEVSLSLSAITINVKGLTLQLKDKIDRMDKKHDPVYICCVQETHFRSKNY